ncbi:hypothetical protein K438DRAFT_1820227 [Mycena galopus ATCC 62051]|nr:hypothetical protein K438DRAFT_1820227 [Mycena galopus ATCC 62051]
MDNQNPELPFDIGWTTVDSGVHDLRLVGLANNETADTGIRCSPQATQPKENSNANNYDSGLSPTGSFPGKDVERGYRHKIRGVDRQSPSCCEG